MNSWRSFKSKHESLDNSFPAVMQRFVQTVEQMEATVLVPMKLVDLPVQDVMPNNTTDLCSARNMDLRKFYFLVQAMKVQICLGDKHVVKNHEGGHVLMDNHEILDACHRLSQFALVARYISEIAAVLSIGVNPKLPSFQDFRTRKTFRFQESLLGAVKTFAHEVESMEKSVLFPCLLQDHNISDQMLQFNVESKTLHDLFVLLKNLRIELLSEKRNFELPDPKLQQKLSELRQTLLQYTVMARSLTVRYKQEVECF